MDYLAIIRKADFIDLFKYGKLNVYSAINFDGKIKVKLRHWEEDDKLIQNSEYIITTLNK